MAFLPYNDLETLEIGATAWPNIVNANFTNIDEALTKRGLFSARPAFGNAGRFYYSTDTNELHYDSGIGWILIANGGATPAAPVVVSATGVTGINSGVYVLVPGMTHTLTAAGNYLAIFSSYGSNSTNNAQNEYGIAINGTIQPYSHRFHGVSNAQHNSALSSQYVLFGAAGTETITTVARRDTGTFSIGDRSLIIQKVG